MFYKVIGSEVKVTDNIFQKCTLQWRRTDWQFTVEDRLVLNIIAR